MRTVVKTVDELIEALGGPEKVARWACMSNHSGVCHWSRRNSIPPGWHLRLLAECAARGITIDLCLFGLEPDEAKVLAERWPITVGGGVACVQSPSP